MEQGADLYVNQEIPVESARIDYVFITHAHIDHSGLLPLLYNHGFRGEVFCTKATEELCQIMLKDSAHIQEFEAEWRNRKNRRAGKPEITPMYSLEDAAGVMEHFCAVDYDSKVEICEGLKVRFEDAGHLLGSASIEMWVTEGEETRKLIFSGDIGNVNRPLIKNPTYLKEADYVIMESTYGDRNHDAPVDYAVELAKVMNATFTRGGNLVIPAFSVGRTQEMLYFMRRIKTEGLLPEYPNFDVYINIGLGTIINLFLLGYIVQFITWVLDTIFGAGIALTLPQQLVITVVALIILTFGLAMYQVAELGVAPYDFVALGLAERFPIPYFALRVGTDAICVLVILIAVGTGFIGWEGSHLGIGTVITAFFLGPLVAYFSKLHKKWVN